MQTTHHKATKLFSMASAVIMTLLFQITALGQAAPPQPISVFFNPSEGLRFGAFFTGSSGGSIIIGADGSRTATGGVIEAGFGYIYGAATFEVKANPGTRISLLNGSDVTLTGSNGGSMTLHLTGSSPVSPFITSAASSAYTLVNIGGTLTVGSSVVNPPGSYSGAFLITFMQE